MTFPQKLFGLLALVLVLSGCATYPKPDPSLIRWGSDYPWFEANEHAESISGGAWEITPTGSMRPFLEASDYVVGDFAFPWANIRAGDLLVYDPDWSDAAIPLVCHLAVEKSGDGWIMSGISNRYSESGSRSLLVDDYRARVIQVYTARTKP